MSGSVRMLLPVMATREIDGRAVAQPVVGEEEGWGGVGRVGDGRGGGRGVAERGNGRTGGSGGVEELGLGE